MKLQSPVIALIIVAFSCLTAAGQQAGEARPISVGIVLDTSGSMGTKLALARRSIAELVKPVSSLDEFALIQAADLPRILSGFANTVDVLQSQTASIQSRGRSALLDAIYLGLQLTKTGRNERRVLVVISDGDDNSSRYSETEIRNAIRETGVPVYVIGIHEPISNSSPLLQITECARGRYFDVESTSSLPQMALELRTAMRAGP